MCEVYCIEKRVYFINCGNWECVCIMLFPLPVSGLLAQKELTIANLKAKVAEVLALSPASGFSTVVISAPPGGPEQLAAFSGSYTPPSTGSHTPPHSDASAFTPPPAAPQNVPHNAPIQSSPAAATPTQRAASPQEDIVASSSLNPMANDYTPKMSQ